MSVVTQTPDAAHKTSVRKERDAVYWTELEFRRLGNMVAEMIQSKRYIGDDEESDIERELLRKRVDAMRRKALRILVRAEMFAESGEMFWPGLDPSLTEPVSLAEEYVRVVTNYQAALDEEESRVNMIRKNGLGSRSPDFPEVNSVALNDEARTVDGVEGERNGSVDIEDISYREALAREAGQVRQTNRDALFDGEGLRKRKKGERRAEGTAGSMAGKYSKEDEELMASHQPIQDQLTNDLADLVSRLKGSVTEINAKIVKDGKVLDEADDAIDRNLSGITGHRDNFGAFTRSTSTSWWTIWGLLGVVVFIFLGFLVLTRIPV